MTRVYDVPFFGPPIPKEGVFDKDDEFRNFLLAKLINVENAGHHSKKFNTMATRTRRQYLLDLANSYSSSQSIEQVHVSRFDSMLCHTHMYTRTHTYTHTHTHTYKHTRTHTYIQTHTHTPTHTYTHYCKTCYTIQLIYYCIVRNFLSTIFCKFSEKISIRENIIVNMLFPYISTVMTYLFVKN